MAIKNQAIIIGIIFKFFLMAFLAAAILELLKPGIVINVISGEFLLVILVLLFIFSCLVREQDRASKVNKFNSSTLSFRKNL